MAEWIARTRGVLLGTIEAPNLATAMRKARELWPTVREPDIVSAINDQLDREELSARARAKKHNDQLDQEELRRRRKTAYRRKHRFGPLQKPTR